MPSAAYFVWGAAGRPLEPAQPIRDYVDRLKLAFPQGAAANLFSWYANEFHYAATPPQDHTPYSATGWPAPCPQWFVFATDVMHRPDLGVDCNALFPYWLAEAKAGRTPWVKYLIWQAKSYDVRNGWAPRANSGHYDHIHISCRTDHRTTSLGSWQLVPGAPNEGEPMAQQVLVKFTGTPVEFGGPNQVFLADGILLRAVKATDLGSGKIANDGTHHSNGFLLSPLGNGGAVFQSNDWSNHEQWGVLYPPPAAIVAFPPEEVATLATAVAAELDVPTASQIAEAVADELHSRTAE